MPLEQAAHALGFNDARDRTAAGRLQAMEARQEEVSPSVLLKMAKAYRRSLLIFYLEEPPRTGDRGQDFRTVPGAQPPFYNPLLNALIRDLHARLAIVRDVAQDTETKPLDFVGTPSMDVPPQELARRISERLHPSVEEFRAQRTAEQAFNYLRRKVEEAGIYVLLLGNLGSHHTNIPVEIFRGFPADRCMVTVESSRPSAQRQNRRVPDVAMRWAFPGAASSSSIKTWVSARAGLNVYRSAGRLFSTSGQQNGAPFICVSDSIASKFHLVASPAAFQASPYIPR